MTELQMDCFGSVLLFKKGEGYCARCPARVACEEEVGRNEVELQEALGRPIYETGGKYWAGGIILSRQRKAIAEAQLAGRAVSVAAAPAPATKPAPTPAPVVTAPVERRTPAEAMDTPGLKVKVEAELNSWVKKGIDPALIEKDQNPFSATNGSKFATLFADAWLRRPEKLLTKGQLKDEIVKLQLELGMPVWSDGSLQSNINIMSGAFKACGYDLLQE